jgi:hypothetical protein
MYNTLLLKAFEKAESEIQSNKPTHSAQHLSDFIQEQSGEPYGEKSLRTHYSTAKKGEDIDLKKFVANALSVYLGYNSFEDFVKAQPSKPVEPSGMPPRYKWAIAGLLFILLFVAISYLQFNKQRWMVWQENHYVEVKFDEKLLQEGKLKLYNEDRINNLKKIDANCDTRYRSHDGSALVWYGKNPGGELQYFTAPGLHPETGKTLRELSKYMFDKYACPK